MSGEYKLEKRTQDRTNAVNCMFAQIWCKHAGGINSLEKFLFKNFYHLNSLRAKTSVMSFAALQKSGFWSDPTGGGAGGARGAKKRLYRQGCTHIPAKDQRSSTHLFDQSWAAPAVYRLPTLRTKKKKQTCTRRHISVVPVLENPTCTWQNPSARGTRYNWGLSGTFC